MSTTHDDIHTFNQAINMASATGQRIPKFLEVTFVKADINAGTITSAGLPTNALVLGAHMVITTALTYSNGGTTGVSAKIGNADDDGFGTSTAIAGTAGYRRFPPGALVGGVVAGSTGGVIGTFTATGGAADLAHVSAGAGKVVIDYIEV